METSYYEKMNKGLQYIDAIFQIIFDKSNHMSLLDPRYIYRGVRGHYFTSCRNIDKWDNKKPQLLKELRDNADKNSPSYKRFEHVITKQDVDITDYEIYTILKTKYIEEVEKKEDVKDGKVSPISILNDYFSRREAVNEEFKIYNDIIKVIAPYHIKSGAAVRLGKSLEERNHVDYINYLHYLINDAKLRFSEYKEKNYSDLEILADLQHKGAGSCLVDFSTNMFISLWFAVQPADNVEDDISYLFCYDVNQDMIEKDNLSTLSEKDYKNRTIDELLFETRKTNKYTGDASYKFWLWRPSFLNERIARQDSMFIFGLEAFNLKEHGVIAIPIFPKWKKPILMVLETFMGLNEASIYCDRNGYAQANSKLKPYGKFPQQEDESKKLETQEKGCEPEKDKEKKLTIDHFQIGMECLLKCEYSSAYQYFCRYEDTLENKDKDAKHINRKKSSTAIVGKKELTVPDVEKYMKEIELLFSKALCLKHMDKTYQAIVYYEKALEKSNILKFAFDKYCKEVATDVRYESYQEYLKNKRLKILNDYIELLYIVDKYWDAYRIIKENIIYEKQFDAIAVAHMEQLWVLTMLQGKVMHVKNNEKMSIKELIKIDENYAILKENLGFNRIPSEGYPFLNLLECYFDNIVNIIVDNVQYYKINIDIENKIKKVISFVSATQKGNKDCKIDTKEIIPSHYSWQFKHMYRYIEKLKDVDNNKYHTLMDMTSKLQGLTEQVNSLLTIKPY